MQDIARTNAVHLIRRCFRADLRIQTGTGNRHQINRNRGSLHGRIGFQQSVNPLLDQSVLFLPGRGFVAGPGVHGGVAVLVGKGSQVQIHGAAPQVLQLGELLGQQLGAVGFAVNFNDAAVCLMGKR